MRDVLRTTMPALGLDRKMLAGHKPCAHIAAALRRRLARAPRRGKDHGRGRGKAPSRPSTRKKALTGRAAQPLPHCPGTLRGSLERICQVVLDRCEGRVRSAQDRSALVRSSVEERQCMVFLFRQFPLHSRAGGFPRRGLYYILFLGFFLS